MKKIIVSLFIAFAFISCKREKDEIHKTPEKLGEETLLNTDLLNVPYTLNQVLVFKDSLSDSITFTVQQRTNEYQTYYVNSGAIEQDYYLQEKNITTLFSDSLTPSSQLIIYAKQPEAIDQSDGLKSMLFKFYLPAEPNTDFYSCGIRYDAQLNFYATQTMVPIVKHTNYSILSHSFSNVYELNNIVQSGINPTTKLYYSISEGIVGFKKLSGQEWYLAN